MATALQGPVVLDLLMGVSVVVLAFGAAAYLLQVVFSLFGGRGAW